MWRLDIYAVWQKYLYNVVIIVSYNINVNNWNRI